MSDVCDSIRSRLHREVICDFCGTAAYQRGKNYFETGRVLSLKVLADKEDDDVIRQYDGIHLIAYARGSGNNKYKQDIELTVFDGELDIDGQCTCPVGYNCKHVAAACLHFIKQASNATVGDRRAPAGHQHSVDDWFEKLAGAVAETQVFSPPLDRDYLVYVIKPRIARGAARNGIEIARLGVDIRATRPRKNGTGFVQGRSVSRDSLDYAYSSYQWEVQPIDREISAFLKSLEQPTHAHGSRELRGRSGGLALMSMLQTGRCYWSEIGGVQLIAADPRTIDCHWLGKKDHYSLQLSMEKPALLLPTEPPMYLDESSGEVGQLDCNGLSGGMLEVLAETPVVSREQGAQFSRQLRQTFPQLNLPTPVDVAVRYNDGEQVKPCLRLQQQRAADGYRHSLSLQFDYAGDVVAPAPLEDVSILSSDQGIIHIKRNSDVERDAIQQLLSLGFAPLPGVVHQSAPLTLVPAVDSEIESVAVWAEFIERDIEKLRDNGWQVDIDDSFSLEFIDGDWQTSIAEFGSGESGNDWFELRFDLDIDGQMVPLAPLLIPVLEEDPDTLPDIITLPLDDGNRYVRLPSERVRPFLKTLRELFERVPPDDEGAIRLSRFDALLLDQLGDSKKQIKGAQKLRKLAERLRDFEGIKNVPVPEGFGANLRAYQQAGLNWLQFLREYEFNGVLADDMGLGKTVQTLAHLLVEKNSGRLQQPALVIAPTSLMGNWRREAEKFAPQLRVLVLYGKDRARDFSRIGSNDLVLTTYPLLSRDTDALLTHDYHYIVLDEAQAIKNPTTKLARTVREFKANHRLCLTGTPLENHLGELWSLYDFLMPGFLGNLQVFNRCYRVPIEKHGSVERREQLARRIQPFLMRREKNEVATELPPKTEIIHNIEFGKDQAQLYEGIRVAMDKRVRDSIKSQGLSRSHITILDALLKLRQICCDPRLLKLDTAKNVQHSAKLDWLMELLPTQLEEGRRVLVFSQFTSMLGLIETELKNLGINYTKLTGQTRKRDEAIQQFREGDVNLFLISLKAGGVGLNLTEADTVIIYDPWWNPAVEAQAIDRAHRIGQDKPVFVYKLVTANSVEEKMLAMQERKRTLAKGIYSDNNEGDSALLDEHALSELFAPLEQVPRQTGVQTVNARWKK